MKKLVSILMIMAVGLGLAIQSKAGERIEPSQVPNELKTFVVTNFGENAKIVAAERDRQGLKYEYDVMLNSGFKIEWGADNQWEEVEGCGVPASIVGEAIQSYVNNNFNELYIVKIERTRKGYEVTLVNGTELKFDKNDIFISAKEKR